MRILIASLSAVAVQPLVFLVRLAPVLFAAPGAMNGLGLFLTGVVAVAAVMVLLLGIPSFLLLRKFGRTSWKSLASAGAVAGALPVALFWPRRREGYSAGHTWHGTFVETYINGVPTKYAWLNYGEDVLLFGLHGLIGALVFYAVWRRLGGDANLSAQAP